LHEEIPYVCDLCGGDPRCVRECNLGAILFEPEKREAVSLEEWAGKNKNLSSDEKRLRFTLSQADHLRKEWILLRRT